jgi:C-terminal processing protease CtpA/Prc
MSPLKKTLSAHAGLKGRIFVLIGPGTFSSAILNAIELKQQGATLVGEPTGGGAGHYGEVKILTLPNSKLAVRYTSKFFSAPKGLDGSSLQPDLPAPTTLTDALSGRDTAFFAAMGVK